MRCLQFDEALKNPSPSSDSIYSKYSVDVKKRVSIVASCYTDCTQLKQLANADVFFFKLVFHNNNVAICSNSHAGLYQVMKPTAKIIICGTPNESKFTTTLNLNLPLQFNEKEKQRKSGYNCSAMGKAISTMLLLEIAQFVLRFGRWSLSHCLRE